MLRTQGCNLRLELDAMVGPDLGPSDPEFWRATARRHFSITERRQALASRLESTKPFSYRFQLKTQDTPIPVGELQTMSSIKETLLLLTGECEVAQRPNGFFCEKHQRAIDADKGRCSYITERFARNEGEKRSREQIQQYVNEVLGVRDPKTLRRLTR